MASTRTRNGRIIGLYRDAQGRQKSAGTWPTQAEALKAAKHAEALANPPETTMVYASEKRGHRTVAPVTCRAGLKVTGSKTARAKGTRAVLSPSSVTSAPR